MNDRGRVPFALVGVLLVLTSTTLAVTTVTHESPGSPAIDDAMESATAAAVTELRGAADEAATEAAIAPVTEPAETTAGNAIDKDQPFRDALRLRLYLRAVERLDGVETRRGDVTVAASLPAVEATTEGYRTAIERVQIQRAGKDDAAMRVVIDGVTLTAERNGKTVTTVERSPEFVVSTPVLLLHDRTERFERRANAPVTRAGLGQRLTTRLYPIAWTRGYAQYGGAPISTVLGMRHVELSTNDALLAEQREVFGEADPDGHRGVAAAGRRVATTDALVGVGGKEEWQDAVLEAADEFGEDPPPERPVGTWRDEPDEQGVTVGVNASADHAFADTIGVSGSDLLGEQLDRAHTVEARLVATRNTRGRSQWGYRSPGPGWSHASTDTEETVTIRRVSHRGPHADGWKSIESATFDVQISRVSTREWTRENRTTTTRAFRYRSYRVRVGVQARTPPIAGVPDGRLDGWLRRAADDAIGEVTPEPGGLEDVAERKARGRSVRSTSASTASPSIDRKAVESELGQLRERTRDITVTVPAPAVGTGRANPADQLQREVDNRREELLGVSGRTASERTIRATRLAYLDSLDSELATRRSAFDSASDGIDGELTNHLDHTRLDAALAAHRTASSPSADPIDDPAGDLSLAVDTAPSYLTTSEVTRDRIDERGGGTVYPLSSRTYNVFSSPHGQVASRIVDRIPFLGTERVSLSTAARTLAATEPGTPHHDDLESEVAAATDHVRGELIAELVEAGVPEHDARDALRNDASVADDALLLANGTTIQRTARTIDAQVSSERLELRLRTRLDAELQASSARPTEPTTTAAQEAARERYSEELEDVVADGIESMEDGARARMLGERLGALPSGLPLAPIPGYWYATANVWYVNVTGQYERFAVRTNRGDGAATVTYLRDNRTAHITHDGESRRLGAADRVSFQTRTAVVVVVPPGPRGVGNTDGVPDKRSPGWGS